jgi:ribosomal protein L28
MSRKCDITGKKVETGHSKKHRRGSSGGGGQWRFKSQKTKREWRPNLRKAKVVKDGVKQTVTVSMKAYKKLRTGSSLNGYTLA